MTRSSFPTTVKVVLGESAVASLAASGAVLLEWPVWAMFIGWISYFTRGVTARHGLVNLACVAGGMAVGVLAAVAMAELSPLLGTLTTGAVVFAVATVVLPMRHVPVFNNLLGFFLGLVGWFAAHQPPSMEAWLTLAGSAALGATAAWFASRLHHHIAATAPHRHGSAAA
jgi:hypothetical protein